MKQGREPQQSPNWEGRKDHQGFMDEGFPFREGFPRLIYKRFGWPYAEPLLFTVITRDGGRETAVVDTTTESRNEGLTWRTWPDRRVVAPHTVVAWQEQKDIEK